MKFVECDTCRAKPGTPALCSGCLANREAIDKLQNATQSFFNIAMCYVKFDVAVKMKERLDKVMP